MFGAMGLNILFYRLYRAGLTQYALRCFLLISLLATSFLVHAQQPSPAIPITQTTVASIPKTSKTAVPYHAGVPKHRAEKMSQQLGKQLVLDAATVARVKTAALERGQKIDVFKPIPIRIRPRTRL